MGLRKPVPACAELLHAAARPGGAAACDLCRLADAPDRRRHHGGRPVHRARHHRHHGLELHLRGLWQRLVCRGAVLRAEGRGARHRGRGAGARRKARAAQQHHDRAGRDRLRRHLLLCRPLPDHHHRRRPDRLFRRQKRTQRICRRRPWQCERRRHRQRARRRGAGARPARHRARVARRPVLGGAVVRSHRCDPDDAQVRPTRLARSRCSSPRWRW